jgi:hypothetical protein
VPFMRFMEKLMREAQKAAAKKQVSIGGIEK